MKRFGALFGMLALLCAGTACAQTAYTTQDVIAEAALAMLNHGPREEAQFHVYGCGIIEEQTQEARLIVGAYVHHGVYKMDHGTPAYYAGGDTVVRVEFDISTPGAYRIEDWRQARDGEWHAKDCEEMFSAAGFARLYGEERQAIIQASRRDAQDRAECFASFYERGKRLAGCRAFGVEESGEAILAGGAYPGYEIMSEADGGKVLAKVQNGALRVRKIEREGKLGERVIDYPPLPLTQAALARLEREPLDALFGFAGGVTVHNPQAIDGDKLCPGEEIIDCDVNSDALMLMTQSGAGERHVIRVRYDAKTYAYDAERSGAMNKTARLDAYHNMDDEVKITWYARDGHPRYAYFTLAADGRYLLTYCDFAYGANYDGLYRDTFYGAGVNNEMIFGTLPGNDLMHTDPAALPDTFEAAAAQLDRTGWAVVNNPNPEDRLHLRAQPDKGADSLGKFYNRTPLQVLERQGEWTHVRIGLDGTLDGWMMTRFLAFGEAADGVGCAFVHGLNLRAEYEGVYAYMDGRPTWRSGAAYDEHQTFIIGVVEDEFYIVLTRNGHTGYMPTTWFEKGQG